MSKETKDAKEAGERKELESLILHHLADASTIPDSLTFLPSTPFAHLSHSFLTSTLQSLASSALVALTPIDHSLYTLTPEGDDYATYGTPEGQLLALLHHSAPAGVNLKEGEAALGKEKWEIARGKGMKERWLVLDKERGELRLKEGAEVTDAVKEQLLRVRAGQGNELDPKLIVELKKRKMIALTSAHSHSTHCRMAGSGDEHCISSS